MKRLLMVIILILALNAYAADYYVSTAGSDSNPGTQAQPFASIQYALNTCVSGDIVHLDGSTWNETVVKHDLSFTLIGDYNGPNGMGGRDNSIVNGTIASGTSQMYGTAPATSVISLNAKGIAYCANLSGGNGLVEDCEVSGGSINGAMMAIKSCYVHDSPGVGISLWKCASVTNSRIYDNMGLGFKLFPVIQAIV